MILSLIDVLFHQKNHHSNNNFSELFEVGGTSVHYFIIKIIIFQNFLKLVGPQFTDTISSLIIFQNFLNSYYLPTAEPTRAAPDS